MYVKVASNLYAEPETLLQCHYCSSSLSVIMEEQHLSFLHVFQINLDKVQYASLQENLQHCEFKPHTIHVHRGRFQIENPQNRASGSYSFPETEMFTSVLFLTFLPKSRFQR